jgi:hypothetical protein
VAFAFLSLGEVTPVPILWRLVLGCLSLGEPVRVRRLVLVVAHLAPLLDPLVRVMVAATIQGFGPRRVVNELCSSGQWLVGIGTGQPTSILSGPDPPPK